MTEEQRRLGDRSWYRWGPYLADRQWATVREDYSPDGAAWEAFPHRHARSRAYRWGEDGLAGYSDDQQHVCVSLALWNGADPFLKERLFGLTGNQGNHAEDVKELYWYLDGTPSHSYLKMLYKYPQRAFPYDQLLQENERRDKHVREYELLDTGVFDDDRYFDVVVEYAKLDADDVFMRITATNRGPDAADLTIIPQITLRNCWSWDPGAVRPWMARTDRAAMRIKHADLGNLNAYFTPSDDLVFCDNETNFRELFGTEAITSHPKDAIHKAVVDGDRSMLSEGDGGTKCGSLHRTTLDPGESRSVMLRLTPKQPTEPFAEAEATFAQRIEEADAFYASLPCSHDDEDHRRVQRQAYAGLIWSKQWYYFDVERWLSGDTGQPKPPASRQRNADWRHLNNADVPADARPVGVPVVRSVGSRLPRGGDRADRRGFRQAPARAAHPRVVHAPQRSAPRLRVGLRRRPTRPCTPGRRGASTGSMHASTASATCGSSSASSTSCC